MSPPPETIRALSSSSNLPGSGSPTGSMIGTPPASRDGVDVAGRDREGRDALAGARVGGDADEVEVAWR